MKRCVMLGILVLSSWALPAAAADTDAHLFLDDFDSYAAGTLPPGWNIVWDGAGYDLQAVTSARAFSAPNAFRLVGRPNWSAVVERGFASDSDFIGYEFKILIEAVGRGGEEHPAFFKYQAEGNRWGTYYGAVRFQHPSGLILAEDGTPLAKWRPRTWHSVRVILDRAQRTYDVWIDGAQVGYELAINARSPDVIDALALVSGHAGVPVYYDDVAVFVPAFDNDGDGIPDWLDPCPDVHPGLIDINTDGCIDTNIDIAVYLKEQVVPIASELPDAATVCLESALVGLELAAFEASIEGMLCAAEVLDTAGPGPAADAQYAVGLSAQTTALLAIHQQTLLVGADDPNVIAAGALAELGVELLEQLRIPEAVSQFLEAVSQLVEDEKPSILVEVDRRNAWLRIWEKHTSTFAAWGEQVISAIRVTNTGNVDLHDIEVWQTWSDFETTIDVLHVGESKMVNVGTLGIDMIEYVVREADPDPFIMLSTAQCRHNGVWVRDSAMCEVDIIHPSIDVTIQAPSTTRPGDLVSLQVTVTNTGDVPLRSVWYFFYGGLSRWRAIDREHIGDMAPGESRFYHYHYLIPKTSSGGLVFRSVALGGRDYDTGISWEIFGRRIEDRASHRMRVVR